MNLPEIARHHKHNLPPLAPLQLPPGVHVHNTSAYTDRGVLFLSVMTDDGHVTTYEFEGEGLEAIREALTPQSQVTLMWSPSFTRTPDMVGEPWDAIAKAQADDADTLVIS